MNSSSRHRVPVKLISIVLLLASVAACGTRVGRDEVISALGSSETVTETEQGQATSDLTPAAAGAETVGPGLGGGTAITVEAGGGTTGGTAGGTTGASPGAASPVAATGAVDPSLPTVILGNIGEYSGPVAASLGGARPMASVMEQWLNDNGGLGGHPVRVIVADNQGDPSRYLSLVRDMVENQGVVAFLGNQIPLTAPGADAYLRGKGIPIIGGEGAHSLWQTSPVMFYPGSTWGPLWIGMAGAAAERKLPKLAVLYCGEAEPCRSGYASLKENPDKIRALGAELTYAAQVSIVQPDYTSECLAAKSSGAQAIITAMDANSLSRVARSCQAQGYRPLFLTGGPALVSGLDSDPNFDGLTVIGIAPSFPWVANDTPGAKAFQEAIQTYNPNMENSAAAAQLWAGGLLLQTATKGLGKTFTSADIVKGLQAVQNFDGGGTVPPISFSAGPRTVINCYFLVELNNNKWTAPQGSKTSCLK